MSSLQHAEPRSASDGRLPAGPPQEFLALLDHLGVLQFGGDDAAAFLQGQLSCDVAGLDSKTSTYGAYCTPKGRMLANFLLWRVEAGFLMVLSRDIVPALHRQISKFVLRSKVKISDVSGTLRLAGAAGAMAERALAEFFRDLPSTPNEVRSVDGIGSLVRLKDGRLLAAPAAEVLQKLASRLEPANARVWRWMDIREGLPLITARTQDQLIPQMVNLELIGGVSFDKGCYTGQEIVARAQHLGKVKRRMFLANVSDAAQAGDALFSDDLGAQASGTIVNAEASPDGGYDVLAVLHAASAENSTVRLKAPGGPALRFLALPYAAT